MQRLGAFEATALLRTIMAEIDVAVFTFDPERKPRLVNRAGEHLLKRPIDKLLGRTSRELRLDGCLQADEDAPLTLVFPGATGRWGVGRRSWKCDCRCRGKVVRRFRFVPMQGKWNKR